MKKAVKKDSKLRMVIVGPPKSGKTFTSLTVGVGLGKKVGLIDAERGSASKYADLFDFDVEELDGKYSPQLYRRKIKEFENNYDVLIIDSLSHAWFGTEGALEQADKAGERLKNRFRAWAEVTPHHYALVDAILTARCHIIATLRVKTEYVMEYDEKTRKTIPRKVGLQPIFREGIEYEFDLVADMDQEHQLVVSGSRCVALDGFVAHKPGENFIEPLRLWLGIDAERNQPTSAPIVHTDPETSTDETETPIILIPDPPPQEPEIVQAALEEFPGSEVGHKAGPDEPLWGEPELACPEIRELMEKIPVVLKPLKPNWKQGELEEVTNMAMFEVCLAFEVGKMHEIPAERLSNVREFMQLDLAAKLRIAGYLPELRTRGDR
jgi:hypothetical protein